MGTAHDGMRDRLGEGKMRWCGSLVRMPMAAVWVSFLMVNGSAFSPSVVVSRRNFMFTRMRDGPALFHTKPHSALTSSSSSGDNDVLINRSDFIVNARNALTAAAATAFSVTAVQALNVAPCNAIEFVPASPYFSGTYNDAIEIMYAQRLAVDNIVNVIINDGNFEEAGFKIMQLNAQTRTAGKIILDTFQENMAKGGDSVLLLRYLSCQKKFALLIDLCDECGDALYTAIKKGKSDIAATASVIKTLNVLQDTKGAYDDFLAELKIYEKAIGK